ncbi:MAG: GTP cyclohydrolase I FolE [Deltaproteobacteria bacterium]|nr:GTP cyclohydrolase I FolE [Deltaproteobacteria bacterium]
MTEGARRPFDHCRAERAIRELLIAIGEDPMREGLRDTPARVARAFAEMTGGLRDDPGKHLARVFDEAADELVVVRDIQFTSMCEHHLLPFTGVVHVAYLPADGKVVGLSKLARTVEVFARRPQVQERLTRQVADAIAEHLGAAAVGVHVESEHLCMRVRGVRQPEAAMTTVAWRGLWKTDAVARGEVAALFRGK